MGKARIRAVEDYLRGIFPGATVEHRHDFITDVQKFTVRFDQGPPLALQITDEVLDDLGEADVRGFLDRQALGETLKKLAGTGQGLLLATDGLKAIGDE